MKKFIIFLIMISNIYNISCTKQQNKSNTPELINVVKVDIIQNTKRLTGSKLKNIIDNPNILMRASNNDFASIKLIKDPLYKETYDLKCIFKDSEKLSKITEKRGVGLVFYINNKFREQVISSGRFNSGIIYFGSFKKDEIIELLGKDIFNSYQDEWNKEKKVN